MRIILAFLFIYVSTCSDDGSDISFDEHLTKLSSVRHPMYHGGRKWKKARDYIRNTMASNGIVHFSDQNFTTAIGSYAGSVKQEEGVNIIGIVKGYRRSGPVIVIGADYDTPMDANPIKNNAGGIALMLETIKLFMERVRSDSLSLVNTVIFVAFDLNTKEYSTSGTGRPGSYHFVHHWLSVFLKENGATLAGALILDSVTTVNYEKGSQFLAPGFDAAFPDAYNRITNRGNKGNFLAIVSTSNQTSNPVRQEFIDNYHKDRMLRPYYLQTMDLHLSVEAVTSEVVRLIDHQAHFHFWTYDKQTLPAFLLFDTDKSRNEPTLKCRRECDVETFLDPDRTRFMTNTVYTILSVLENLQMEENEEPNSSEKSAASSLTGLLVLIVAYTLYK